MTKKVLFIDVDGTLVGFKDGQSIIPESAKEAIRQARQNGHLAFLCTGRSMAEIYKEIQNIGFDGIIGAAGGFVTFHGETIFHKRLPKETAEGIANYLNENKVSYYLESNTGVYCNDLFMDWMKERFDMEDVQEGTFQSICKPLSLVDYDDINKVSFISSTLSYEEIESRYKDDFYVVKASWGDATDAGEISNQGINKATAIHFLLNHLNLEDADTYGFGDSMNDIEMFNCVKHSIAMGDSRHGLKELAEYVTKDVLDDGIYFACQHYGLI